MSRWSALYRWSPQAVRLGKWLRRMVHPHDRTVRRIERNKPGQLLQPAATTSVGRYPEIIAFVAARMKEIERPCLLSWGCSSGAELMALRAAVPHARIVGVDINPRSLAAARQAIGSDPEIELIETGDPVDLAGQHFDAVFCMAVMRHGQLQELEPESCASVLPFAKVESFATALTNLVRPGGLLAVWNMHFSLTDMALAERLTAELDLERGQFANQPLYGRDNRRLNGKSCTTAVFRLVD